jgi:hypothetical protein
MESAFLKAMRWRSHRPAHAGFIARKCRWKVPVIVRRIMVNHVLRGLTRRYPPLVVLSVVRNADCCEWERVRNIGSRLTIRLAFGRL